MDLNILQINYDSSISKDLGLRTWAMIVSIDPSDRTLVKLDSLVNFLPGDTVLLGGKVNPNNPEILDWNMYAIDMSSAVNMGVVGFITEIVPTLSAVKLSISAPDTVTTGHLIIKMSGGPRAKTSSGILYLAQYIQKLLMNPKGTGVINKEAGSMLHTMITGRPSISTSQDSKMQLMSYIKDVEDFVIRHQDRTNPGRDPNELLRSLVVRDAYYDYNNQKWTIAITIVSMTGDIASIIA